VCPLLITQYLTNLVTSSRQCYLHNLLTKYFHSDHLKWQHTSLFVALEKPAYLSVMFWWNILHIVVFADSLHFLWQCLWHSQCIASRNRSTYSQPTSCPTSSWIHTWNYPWEVRCCAVHYSVVILVHTEERAVLTTSFPELIICLDQPAAKASPEFTAKTRWNLCRTCHCPTVQPIKREALNKSCRVL